jgi:hypothetical protein
MNFDTRTILDVVILDKDLETVLASLIEAERIIWYETGENSQNQFVKSIIPLIKDELKFYMKTKLYRKKLGFLKNLVDLEKVDYFHLIPAVAPKI